MPVKSTPMLKFLPILFLLISVSVSAQNPVPNPDFETWMTGNPVNWATSNSPPYVSNISQVSDAHSGNWAIRGEVVNFFGDPVAPFAQSSVDSGFLVTQNYSNMTFWYKAGLTGNDILNIGMYFNDSSGALCAYGGTFLNQSTNTYTLVNVPITGNLTSPAWGRILFTIDDSLGNGSGSIGSWFEADDITLTNAVAIPESDQESRLAVFPNPASDEILISVPENQGEILRTEILDVSGKIVKSRNNAGMGYPSLRLNVEDLAGGVYMIRAMTGTDVLTRKIIIENGY